MVGRQVFICVNIVDWYSTSFVRTRSIVEVVLPSKEYLVGSFVL